MEQKTAEKAAKWWADKLRVFAELDNGDKSENGEGIMFLGLLVQVIEKTKRTPEQADAFEKSLADVLMKENPRWGFGVDYDPDKILTDAAEAAGVDLGVASLPWKTMMFIHEETVSVRCGYGAPVVTLE